MNTRRIIHPQDSIRRKYARTLRTLRATERAFDAFMRSDRSHDERNAYAAKANAEYFALKAKLKALRGAYADHAPMC